jgi:hypothetical protein
VQADVLPVSPDCELTQSRALLLRGLGCEPCSVSQFGQADLLPGMVKVQTLGGCANASPTAGQVLYCDRACRYSNGAGAGAALALLQTAREETDRSRRLGYLSEDSEYKALDHDISSLEVSRQRTG